jgi:hypothetical protein
MSDEQSQSTRSNGTEPQTLFRFTTDGVDLEFAGTEHFVEMQVQRFRSFLESAVGIQGEPQAPAAATEPKAPQGLEAFYAARPLRTGRGAIQDHIMLFFHYLQDEQGRREVTGNDINFCFSQLGIELPKNLNNTLGMLKRNQKLLQEGTRRGLYQLSPQGKQYVTERFQPT